MIEVEVVKNTLLIHFEGRDNRWSKKLAIGRMELPFTEMNKTLEE